MTNVRSAGRGSINASKQILLLEENFNSITKFDYLVLELKLIITITKK